jgi:hypothetical protein
MPTLALEKKKIEVGDAKKKNFRKIPSSQASVDYRSKSAPRSLAAFAAASFCSFSSSCRFPVETNRKEGRDFKIWANIMNEDGTIQHSRFLSNRSCLCSSSTPSSLAIASDFVFAKLITWKKRGAPLHHRQLPNEPVASPVRHPMGYVLMEVRVNLP